jgi:hypothetical protein
MSQFYRGSEPRTRLLQKFRNFFPRVRAVMAASFVVIPASLGMLQPLVANAATTAALSISGTPASSVQTGQTYSFQPSVAGGSGKALRFSIANHPGWTTFDSATGRLTGSYDSSGTFSGIVIGVTDGTTTAALPPFSIRVNWASSGTSAGSTQPLKIGGSPAAYVQAGQTYSFQPSVSGGNGKTVRYSIANHPSWTTFNTATGQLTGSYNSSGTFSGIVISATDGTTTASQWHAGYSRNGGHGL